jgi:hypothetical protein
MSGLSGVPVPVEAWGPSRRVRSRSGSISAALAAPPSGGCGGVERDTGACRRRRGPITAQPRRQCHRRRRARAHAAAHPLRAGYAPARGGPPTPCRQVRLHSATGRGQCHGPAAPAGRAGADPRATAAAGRGRGTGHSACTWAGVGEEGPQGRGRRAQPGGGRAAGAGPALGRHAECKSMRSMRARPRPADAGSRPAGTGAGSRRRAAARRRAGARVFFGGGGGGGGGGGPQRGRFTGAEAGAGGRRSFVLRHRIGPGVWGSKGIGAGRRVAKGRRQGRGPAALRRRGARRPRAGRAGWGVGVGRGSGGLRAGAPGRGRLIAEAAGAWGGGRREGARHLGRTDASGSSVSGSGQVGERSGGGGPGGRGGQRAAGGAHGRRAAQAGRAAWGCCGLLARAPGPWGQRREGVAKRRAADRGCGGAAGSRFGGLMAGPGPPHPAGLVGGAGRAAARGPRAAAGRRAGTRRRAGVGGTIIARGWRQAAGASDLPGGG